MNELTHDSCMRARVPRLCEPCAAGCGDPFLEFAFALILPAAGSSALHRSQSRGTPLDATLPNSPRCAVREGPAHADPRALNEEELKRLSKDCLVSIARDEALPNRSKMNKAQLARTLRRHFRRAAK